MGSSGESSAQRNERMAAQNLANEQKKKATAEKQAFADQEAATSKKKNDLLKRGRGMQGGGREGLMYKGNQVGVK